MAETESLVGDRFFDGLAKAIARSLEVDAAMIGELLPGNADVSMISLWLDDKHCEGITYPLKDSPCEGVVGKTTCIHPKGVQELFPEDELLKDLAIESYAGTPLFDSRGEPIGLLVAMHRRPLGDPALVGMVIEIFAARAAAELERRRYDSELQTANRRLQDALRRADESRARLETVNARLKDYAEISSDLLWETDAAGILVWLSPVDGRDTTQVESDWVGTTPDQLRQRAIIKPDFDQLKSYFAKRESFKMVRLVIGEDEKHATSWAISGKPVYGPDGEFTGYRGSASNITTEIERTRAIEHTRAILEETVSQFPGSLVVFDDSLKIAAANENFYLFHNLDADEFPLGTQLEKIVRHNARHGSFGDQDVEEAIAAQLQLIDHILKGSGENAAHFQHESLSGRYLDANIYRMPGGGLAIASIDITDARQSEQDLKESRDLLQAIFDSFPGGIAVFDAEARLVSVNDRYYELLGLEPAAHPVGSSYSAMVRALAARGWYGEGDVDAIVAKRLAALASEPKGEFERQLADGRVIEVRITPLLGGGSIRSCFDITPRKEAERALIAAKEEAETANRTKSAFLAAMSHEIRTPLNGVLGMAHVLRNSQLNDQQREHIQIIIESGETLLKLLNDVLDLSKIEAGRLELEQTDWDLDGTLQNLQRFWATHFAEKDLRFEIVTNDLLAPDLIGDPTRIKQVLNNLIGNALKFTKEGGVTVTVSQNSVSPETVVTRFEVRDTGIGISEDAKGRIFENFTQADSSTTRKFGGTGLGLSISKQLVQLMGGEIGFESDGTGTMFWFTVPNTAVDRSTASGQSPLRAKIA